MTRVSVFMVVCLFLLLLFLCFPLVFKGNLHSLRKVWKGNSVTPCKILIEALLAVKT